MQDSFFFQAMIYLAAAVIMVPIAKKLGLGSVLGYLLAGFLIGPACLQFISNDGEDIMHYAEFGVVMMLFVIGLELEPSRLWRMRKTIAGMGGIQLVATTAIIFLIAMFFNLDWKQALVIGMIVSMSSTAIVLQSLNEKSQLHTAAGESSFAVLLFQDIAVIPMLAMFPLLASAAIVPGEDAHEGLIHGLPRWGQTITVLGAMAVVIITGRYLLRPFFRFIARTGLREMFTASALLVVVSTTVLMTAVGLSPALGAFLAGVVLANSEYRHELETDIDPFKGLLLGLFFIAVGTSINVNLISEKPLQIIGMALGIMFLKALILFLIGKIFKVRTAQNLIFSIGLSQVGEFAFVLLAASVRTSILSQELHDTMIAAVVISMALTPIAMLINEKFFLPKVCSQEPPGTQRQPDVSSASNPVIIAGYGHFGNTVGRFLRANHIPTTVLDVDSDNVDLLRKMGFHVYYGDASRHDLLEIAGARKAKLVIIAIGDEKKRLEMIETVKKHFPDLRMLVRATNRNDTYDLMNAGMLHIYRQTVDTSLRMGVDVMKMLGYNGKEASRLANVFFKEDELRLKHLSAIRSQEEYVTTIRRYTEEVEAMLEADRILFKTMSDQPEEEKSLVVDMDGVEQEA